MRFAGMHTRCVACAAPFSHESFVLGANTDPHPRGVGASCSSVLLSLPDTLGGQRYPVPMLVSEYPVGFTDHIPAFEIGKRLPAFLARFDCVGGRRGVEI